MSMAIEYDVRSQLQPSDANGFIDGHEAWITWH